MVKSINKGKKFEREVVKRLEKITGSKWFRVPQSGATATAQGVDDPRFKGDVFTDDERYSDLVVECKIRKDPITIIDMVNPKRDLIDWINQAETQAKEKTFLLVFRWNKSKKILAVTNSTQVELELINSVFTFNLKGSFTLYRLGELKF